jgi:hypothetical protein
MAYKQNPGRGPMMKTGKGVPSALLQLDPTDPAKKKSDEKSGTPKYYVPAGGDFKPAPAPTFSSDADESVRSFVKNKYEKKVKADKDFHASRESKMAKKGWAQEGNYIKQPKGSLYVHSVDKKTGDYTLGKTRGNTVNTFKVPRNVMRKKTLRGESLM